MGSLVCLEVRVSVLRGTGTHLEMQCVGRPWRVAVPFVLPDHYTSPVPHKASLWKAGREVTPAVWGLCGYLRELGSTSAWVLVGGHNKWLMDKCLWEQVWALGEDATCCGEA